MTCQYRNRAINDRQQGSALIVGMLILLVLTIIGVTGMNTTTMEEKMAGNTRDLNLAFQAAESGLQGAEGFLTPLIVKPITCNSAPCSVWEKDVATIQGMEDQDNSWWAANATEYGSNGQDLAGLYADPRFVIEDFQFVTDSLTLGHTHPTGRTFYRVTSHGLGGTDTAVSIVQSTFAKRFN